MIKLLALASGHRLHREQLMDALWPDLKPSAAGSNLRKAVHFARQALGGDVVTMRGGIVALETRLEVDVDVFVEAIDRARPAEAIELYTGELLPEDRFESWAEDPRERLRTHYISALREVSQAQERDGDADRAIASLTRLVAADPLDEDANTRLMALHAGRGERQLALRLFRQLERALREQLGVEPSPASVEQFRVIALGPSGAEVGATRVDQGGTRVVTEPSAAERRLVTVVSASLDPPEPGAAGRAARVLETWGGVAIAEGEEVSAVFGLPSVGEDDAERASRAALEVASIAPTKLRVGLATGETTVSGVDVVAARLRPGDRLVQAATALRDGASRGTPLASLRTVRAAGTRLRFADAAPVPGLPADFRAAALLGTAPTDPALTGTLEAPLVGRRSELASLVGLVDEVAAHRVPRLVVLAGAAGVGKSRLVREVAAAVVEQAPSTRVLKGRSLAGGRGATYWALGEVLRGACGISLTDRPRTAERRLRATADKVLGDHSVEDREATVAALATSAGIRLPDNPLDAEKPDEVGRALGVAWPRFAAGLAAAAPTIIVLEDMHWASPELVEMTELVVARSAGPLLVLATTRPELGEVEPGFGASVDATTFALGPLSAAESRELVGHLAAEGEDIDPADRERILDRGEGNPFYLEQLTIHLRETGHEGLPDTLQSLLGARLDALAHPDRRVLQEASVVGRAFWAEPLEEALPGERIGARLALLERRRFVVRRPTSVLPGLEEWAFRHALLHDVAYRSVPRDRRARAHARAGAWLERIAGSRTDEVADLLAHHFEAAHRPRADADADAAIRTKAIDYLVRAGDGAHRRFAIDRALDLHGRALRLCMSGAERARATEAMADDHEAVFHGDAAAASYRTALAVARSGDLAAADPDALARLARKLAWLMAWNPGAFRTSPDPAAAEALVAEGLASDPADVERGWLLLSRGAVARLYRGSEPFGQGSRADPRPLADRIADVDEALDIGRREADDALQAAAGHVRGMLYGFEGRFREMLELARLEVERLPPDVTNLERSDALRRLAVNLINVEADFTGGIELARESRALAGDMNPHQRLHTLWPMMAGLFQLGRIDEVVELADEGAAAFRIEPAVECQFVRDVPVIAGAALAVTGLVGEGRELARLSGDPMTDRSSASAWQARFATLTGRPQDAREISVDKAAERRTYGPQHAYAYLEAVEALEDWDAVEAFLPEARWAVAGNRALAPLIERAIGRACGAAGDTATATRHLRRAAARFGRLGMRREEAAARNALDALVGAERPGRKRGPTQADRTKTTAP
ncbi:MAG: AAA family ATPase [Chloroflexi bacterium]|nr:AAA family ATPase [Chloroflexota bacterium]